MSSQLSAISLSASSFPNYGAVGIGSPDALSPVSKKGEEHDEKEPLQSSSEISDQASVPRDVQDVEWSRLEQIPADIARRILLPMLGDQELWRFSSLSHRCYHLSSPPIPEIEEAYTLPVDVPYTHRHRFFAERLQQDLYIAQRLHLFLKDRLIVQDPIPGLHPLKRMFRDILDLVSREGFLEHIETNRCCYSCRAFYPLRKGRKLKGMVSLADRIVSAVSFLTCGALCGLVTGSLMCCCVPHTSCCGINAAIGTAGGCGVGVLLDTATWCCDERMNSNREDEPEYLERFRRIKEVAEKRSIQPRALAVRPPSPPPPRSRSPRRLPGI